MTFLAATQKPSDGHAETQPFPASYATNIRITESTAHADERIKDRFTVVLLELDHIAVRILDEELQHTIRSATPYGRGVAQLPELLCHDFDGIDLKTQMPVEPTLGCRRTLKKEFEKGTVVAEKEDAVKLARIISEFVGQPASE